MEIKVAQRQNTEDRQATGRQNHLTHIPRYRGAAVAQIQPDRHDDMVRHHGRQRDGGHDHHRSGRRKAPQKGQGCQRLLIEMQRQRQHEHIRVRPCRQHIQTDGGNRDHEQRHPQHIKRKGPACGEQMGFIRILHDNHLKHPWQGDQRNPRQHRQRDPAGPVNGVMRHR